MRGTSSGPEDSERESEKTIYRRTKGLGGTPLSCRLSYWGYISWGFTPAIDPNRELGQPCLRAPKGTARIRSILQIMRHL